jgi:hypothetical protein
MLRWAKRRRRPRRPGRGQAPWYEYSFGWRLLALWRGVPLRSGDLARKLERRAVLSLEYAAKAAWAGLVSAVAATRQGGSTRALRIEVVRELGEGRTLVRSPRGQDPTDLLVNLARRGRDVAEIAGNHQILVTVVAPPRSLPPVTGVIELFRMPIQSRPDRRRVGLDVTVEHLAAAIRTLEAAGITIHHAF